MSLHFQAPLPKAVLDSAASLCAVVLLLLTWGHPALAVDQRPNVLVVLVDDLGYGDLSCYGAQDLRTPHLDQLMAQGVRLNEFYANCCVCSPTRAALLSGRYPGRVGIPGVVRTHEHENWGYLHPDATLLTTFFQDAGYHTALVGKWHLGLRPENHPLRRGFHTFKGFLGDMMDDYWNHRRHGVNYMRDGMEGIDPEGHATDLFTKWSIELLKDSAEKKRPFFQYLAYNAPHAQIQPPSDWLRAYQKREPTTSTKRSQIAAFIEHLDDSIGRVLAALDRFDLASNTVVFFSSDNGGSLRYASSNGPLRGGKTQMYDGGLKVPACFRWPEKIRPGVSDFRALTMDVLPTLADLCDVDLDIPIDGMSLGQELLRGDQPPFDRADYFAWLQGARKEAIRCDRWKLISEGEDGPAELYDLARDPFEKVDLAAEYPQRVAELTDVLRKHRQRAEEVPWRRPASDD